MKFSILTLGCKSNQAESGQIESFFERSLHRKVSIEDSPDVCIVNTCSVTAKSDYESRQLIRRAIKAGSRVYVTGCYAELNATQAKDLGSDICLIKNEDKLSYFNSYFNNELSGISSGDTLTRWVAPTLINTSRGRALVKVQDGCNNRCTYCIIPHARGNSRSRPVAAITDELRRLEDFHGYNEAVLTGIHIGAYGLDLIPAVTLAGLVRHILKNTSRIRIRITSVEATEVTDELIELLREPRVCGHLHVPLQSGDDNILIKMERHYTTDDYRSIIERLCDAVENISLGADVIVGFPGETEESFSVTLGFISSVPLTYLHVFPYSKRKYTKAGQYPGHLTRAVKKQRAAVLRGHSARILGRYMERQAGRTLSAVVENCDGQYHHLTTDNYLKAVTAVAGTKLSKKSLVNLKVTGVDGDHLIGEPVADL